MTEPIDVVIPWVDSSDEVWRAEKAKYSVSETTQTDGEHRYRDWGNLKYFFRAVEKYMPWVRTIHFITYGHLPDWLNLDNPRLHVVKHEDYIPHAYLPTFSSHTIELNMHRINGLSEHFIYFNDDMFVIKPVDEQDFFEGGIPKDVPALNVHCYSLSRPVDLIQINDVGVINEHFDFRTSIKKNISKWFSISNGKALFRTIATIGCPRFPGFYQTHCPQPLLKSTLSTVWEQEPEILDATCKNTFRTERDVNQWVFREWQIASGAFKTRPERFSHAFYCNAKEPLRAIEEAALAIRKQKYSMICINDTPMSNENFETAKMMICQSFETILGNTSSFELH